MQKPCIFLFQYSSCIGEISGSEIFRKLQEQFQYSSCIGEMIMQIINLKINQFQFQYSSCIGEIKYCCKIKRWTDMFQYSSCIGETISNVKTGNKFAQFQYSSCIGEIFLKLSLLHLLKSFNTPVVSVKFKQAINQLNEMQFQYSSCIGEI